jgi:hypothetical protein
MGAAKKAWWYLSNKGGIFVMENVKKTSMLLMLQLLTVLSVTSFTVSWEF